MFVVKYCKEYYPQALSLSAKINSHIMDTCQIEEGEDNQFDLFLNGEIFLSKKHMGKFPQLKDVERCLELLDPYSG